MWGVSAVVLGASILLSDASSEPAISPSDFQRWFVDSSAGRLRIPEAVEQRAKEFRYVFVGGFQSEFKPGYFSQNIKELRAHGVGRRAIHEIYPSARKTIAENSDTFRNEFLDVAETGPEKLVVIAHSRGACDVLAFALENPEFTRDRVAFLFLVQGPFGGTPLADHVLGEGTPMDHQMAMRHRVLCYLFGKMEKALWKRGIHGGLPALSRNASQSFWDRLLAEHANAIPIVGPKTYYITSSIDPTELGFVHGSMGRYLDAYYGPNDSMVPLSDQVLPDLGTDIGALDVGHADLTQRFPSTHAPRRFRKALIQSILMGVGQGEQ